jgi:Amt family ammonium transporter
MEDVMIRRIALAGLTLLSLAVPAFAQDAAAAVVDTGNTTWLLVSAALVMLMTPGLAFFYGGMVSRKNVVSTLLQNYVALAIVGLLWIIVGYSLVFGEGGGYLGGFDMIMLKGVADQFYGTTGIPLLAFVAFQMMFAIITPALITGAFAERVHFKAWVFIMIAWSLLVYVPVAHWVWGPGGWILEKGGLDFAGGLVVHITAGFSGLAAALIFGKRNTNGESPPNDVPMIMLGAALLWFGWFGFNAGSAITSGALASYAFINTFIGAATAFITWMVIDWIVSGKPSAVGSSIGLVVGLVAITPAAGFVDIHAAFIIGIISAIVSNFGIKALNKVTHLDDALDVFACHGIGAVVGAILTGLYASKLVNPAISNEGWLISGDPTLFNANLVGVLAVAGFSMVATFLIIRIVGIFTPIRVAGDVEGEGLDTAIHGEVARFHDRTR